MQERYDQNYCSECSAKISRSEAIITGMCDDCCNEEERSLKEADKILSEKETTSPLEEEKQEVVSVTSKLNEIHAALIDANSIIREIQSLACSLEEAKMDADSLISLAYSVTKKPYEIAQRLYYGS